MTITLSPDHEKVVVEAIDSGAYGGADEVINRALEVLRVEEAWLRERQPVLAGKIERGLADFERGERFTPEESRLDMARRKQEWRAERER